MARKIAAIALGDLILKRDHFRDMFARAELVVASAFLTDVAVSEPLETSDTRSLLRYADVLSNSTEEKHRDLAYGIIALLREYDELIGLEQDAREHARAVSEAVLIQLGNFPGIKTLQKDEAGRFAMPMSRGIVRAAKEVLHATHRGDAVLTDTQFDIAEGLRGADYFSFSGPTSLGKSFILKDALYEIVQRTELDGHCVLLLVPTKALIGQTAADLRGLLKEIPDVNVATFPTLPRLLRDRYSRTIFVLTPERLLRYLAHPVRDIDYLIVDEAQKIIAENDSRSALFYHAIAETTRRFATRLVFASPSINNPEIFLELFQKATNGALAVRERTVSQQRYFVDLIERKQYRFSALTNESIPLESAPSSSDELDLVVERSGERKAIVYINSSAKAAEFALQLAQRLPKLDDKVLNDLSKFVRKYVHKDYFLGECLEHGVAFHHGKMPQEVREKVEACFSDPKSPLQFVVCTSTLLEGVNMPAKNIFVLSDKHGGSNFRKIDFENLVGRAGRLTYDFSGNVVCVRGDAKRWDGSTRDLIAKSEPEKATSFLLPSDNRKKKAYTDIEKVLRGKNLPSGTSADALRNVQQYASILMLHQIDQQATPLRSTFLDKVDGGRDLLRKVTGAVDVPTEVLRRSPNILPVYQAGVWQELQGANQAPLIPYDADLTSIGTFHDVLRRLSVSYNWREEESRGRDPLVSKGSTPDAFDRRLKYRAILMNNWVRGLPLSRLIRNSISFHLERGTITYQDYSQTAGLRTETFNPDSAKHVNIIIEETLRDIEGGLRFRIIGYLQNFYDLSRIALGSELAGINVANLVEYGTTDQRAIELQEIGFSRDVAATLIEKHATRLKFDDEGELVSVDVEALLKELTDTSDVADEVTNILVKVPTATEDVPL